MGLPKASYPTHKMVLPSTKREVQFRPYLVKEEKILLMAAETNNEVQMVEATKQVLRNCILDEDLNIDDMTLFDMQWAFIQLRAKSVGEIVELKVSCIQCDTPNDYHLSLGDLGVVIPDDLDFNIELTADAGKKLGIKMKFPQVGLLDQFTKSEMTDADNAIYMIMSCIDQIWDETTVYDPREQSIEEQMEWIESLNRTDMEKIEKFTSQIPSINKTIEFKCSKCETSNSREIGGMSDFF